MLPLSPSLNVMIGAANKAARSLRRDFREVEHLQVARKGPGDFVTMADLKAEKIIQEELATARPGYGFLMEEKGKIEGGDKTHVWIIDPLDGTTNFLHGIPHFAISIALMREAQLVAAIVYQPITDELFYAEKGQGAFLSAATIPKMRLQVAKRTKLQDAVFACGIPHGVRGGRAAFLAEIDTMLPHIAGLRRFGAAALDLAWVAAGRVDGFWERGLSAWDMAAGALLVSEAGGVVTDIDNGAAYLQTGTIIAANESLHHALRNQLQKTD